MSRVEINSPFSQLGPNEGIDGTGYTSLIYQGKSYLGTNQGLFVHNCPPTSSSVDFELIPGLSEQVWSLKPVGESVWVGHHTGAYVLNNQRLSRLSSVSGAWKFLPLKKHPGYAIEGTYDRLVLYREVSGRWVEEGWIPSNDFV